MAGDLRGDDKSLLKGRNGSMTYCVPECFNRTNAKNYDIFPKEPAYREKRTEHIERENFTLPRHRVCSAHFEGGKKSYLNNEATVFAVCAFELLL